MVIVPAWLQSWILNKCAELCVVVTVVAMQVYHSDLLLRICHLAVSSAVGLQPLAAAAHCWS